MRAFFSMGRRGGGGTGGTAASAGRKLHYEPVTRGTPQTGYGTVPGMQNVVRLGGGGGSSGFPSPPNCSTCPDPCSGSRAKIRVVNAITNGPREGFDVYVENIKQFESIDYTNTSEYTWVEAGEAHVSVRVANQVDTVLWATFDIGVDQPYTLLLLGDANAAKDTPYALAVYLFRDHNIKTEPCYANVRFIHASPRSPAVDVKVGSKAVFENVSYGQFDGRHCSSYQGFPAVSQAGKPYTHVISLQQHSSSTPAGVNDDDDDDDDEAVVVFLKPSSIQFHPGTIYTIFAMGAYNDARFPLSFVVTVDWPEEPMHPCDVHEQTLTDREIRIRDNLRKEVQRSSTGAFQTSVGDRTDGFAYAQLPPIGKQIAFPAEAGVSFRSHGASQQDSALVRVIHSIANVGVSMSLEDEPIVKDLPTGRISEQMLIYPGKYSVKSLVGSSMKANQSVLFKKGGIYTMTMHQGGGDAVMHVHEDIPDPSLCHLKVINMSRRYGKGPGAPTVSKSFESTGSASHPLPIIVSGSREIQGPRPVLVPDNSHVTVFLLDHGDGDDLSVFTNTASLL